MGYFRALVESGFKRDEDGRDLFYPWGTFGSGYIIDTPERREKICNFLAKFYFVSVNGIILAQFMIGWYLTLTFLLVLAVWFLWRIKTLTKSLEMTDVKIGSVEIWKNNARNQDFWFLVFLESILLFGFAVCIFGALNGKVVQGVLSAIFLGVVIILLGCTIILKIYDSTQN